MLYLSNKPEPQSVELQRVLQATDGYLYLGLPQEALRELDGVSLIERTRAIALRARVRVLLHLKRWEDADRLSSKGYEVYPEENEFMVQRAFALQQMKRRHEAVQVLLTAPEWIRRTGILHYNLACYEAQLGNLSAARKCICTAIEMNASFKKNARTDPDLQRLWN